MKTNDVFLALYKEYETVLRNTGIEPKEYEEKVDETTGARLSACRFFRNYLSHKNDPGFLVVSDAQLKFLAQVKDKLIHGQDILKKHIKPVAAATCTPKDKCRDVLMKMSKLRPEKVVVMADDGVMLADIYDIALKAAESKTAKISDVKLTKKGLVFAEPTELMADLPTDTIIVCVKAGMTIDDIVVGIYYPKR